MKAPATMFHLRHDSVTMFHFRHDSVTHKCAGAGYGVCRGPGGPLGDVWGARG